MVTIKGYKDFDEELKKLEFLPCSSMKWDNDAMTTSNSIAYADLAAQVAMLSQKMEDVLGWIRSQVNPIAKDDGNKCRSEGERVIFIEHPNWLIENTLQ